MGDRVMTTEIVIFTKTKGPLTKHIKLSADGKPKSTPAGALAQGSARRVALDGLAQLADVITELGSNQALALGALRADLPAEVKVVTKDKLKGAAGVIAR